MSTPNDPQNPYGEEPQDPAGAQPSAQPPYGAPPPAQPPYGSPPPQPSGAPSYPGQQPPYPEQPSYPAQPQYGAPAQQPYASPQPGLPQAPQYGAPQYPASQYPGGSYPSAPQYAGEYGYGVAPTARNSLGVWSLVLGILSLVVCGVITGIAAIVVGSNAKKAVARGEANNPGMATAGIVLGWVGIALTVVGLVVFGIIRSAHMS